MKYLITKRMKRHERCDIAKKVFKNLHSTGRIVTEGNPLVKVIKAKKKKSLYGGKKVDKIFASTVFSHMGVKVYIIMNRTEGYDTIFNTSPIDAGFVEYVRVIPSGQAVLYTQHLLDRYNQRIHSSKYTTHREILQSFIINNPIKGAMATDKEGGNGVIQRLEEGFILGNFDADNNVFFNTFYDSEEYKDNEMKGRTRAFSNKKNNLTDEEINDFDRLQDDYASGKISLDEFDHQVKSKGYM